MGPPSIENVVVGKLNVNDLVRVQPFLEMVSVIVGLQPNGTVNIGLGMFVALKEPQVVDQVIEYHA